MGYDKLIARIRRRRKWVIALTLTAVLAILFLGSPTEIEVMGESVVSREGLHPALTVLFIIGCLLLELIAYAAVSMPMYVALDLECDPEKHLALNIALGKRKDLDRVCAVDHFLLGNYTEAAECARRISESRVDAIALLGLFQWARCEAFLGNGEELRRLTEEYERRLDGSVRVTAKAREIYRMLDSCLRLMCAIDSGSTEEIEALRGTVKNWGKSKAADGFIDYLRGLSAYKVGDTVDAIYRFKTVAEQYPKTVFARISADYIGRIESETVHN